MAIAYSNGYNYLWCPGLPPSASRVLRIDYIFGPWMRQTVVDDTIGTRWLTLAFGRHRSPGRVVGTSKPRDGRVFLDDMLQTKMHCSSSTEHPAWSGADVRTCFVSVCLMEWDKCSVKSTLHSWFSLDKCCMDPATTHGTSHAPTSHCSIRTSVRNLDKLSSLIFTIMSKMSPFNCMHV